MKSLWKQTHSCGMLYFVSFHVFCFILFCIYGSMLLSEKQGKNLLCAAERYERWYFCAENPRASSKHGKAESSSISRILSWEIKENSHSGLWYTNSFAHNKTLFATVALQETQDILSSSEKMSCDSEMLRLCKLALENSLSNWFHYYKITKIFLWYPAAYIGTRVSREKTPIY